MTEQNKNDTFNACAHLVESEEAIQQFLEEHKDVDTLSLILDKQLELQKFMEKRDDWYLPHFDPKEEKTVGEMMRLLQFSKSNFDKEYFELEDAMGGMSNGAKEASAVNKPWKKDHVKYISKMFKDLSDDDVSEIKMEVVDMFHFFAMIMVTLGMTSEEVKYLYTRKNLENFDRQNRGY